MSTPLTCTKGDGGPHPFVPGEDVDQARDGRSPDPRWCNTCGETAAEPEDSP